jgi:hypothetical protein
MKGVTESGGRRKKEEYVEASKMNYQLSSPVND